MEKPINLLTGSDKITMGVNFDFIGRKCDSRGCTTGLGLWCSYCGTDDQDVAIGVQFLIKRQKSRISSFSK
jgi:hypothetical protein